LPDKAILMSVCMSETFGSTVILAGNFCTGVQDAHADSTAEFPLLNLIKTWHLLVKYIHIT